MKVFIVPATYNEKDNIEKFITILEEEVFPKIEKNYEMHILVADDSSPDGTADIIKKLMKKYSNLGINEGPKKGLGAAYVRAMGYAIENLNADIVMSIDADLQHDPRAVPSFLQKMSTGFDIVIGTRYSDGGTMPKTWPFYRKVFSVVANFTVRIITGRFSIHDWTGGYRAIKKEVFIKEKEKVKAFSGYHFQVAFLYKSLLDGFKVGEVPIHFHSRRQGDSKIAPKEYIVNLLKYVITERINELMRFIKFLFVGGIGFIVQLVFQEISVVIGLSHSFSVGIGAESAIISNFIFNHFWTFSDTKRIKENSSFFIKLFKFNIASLLSIFIQIVAVWVAERLLGPTINLLHFNLPTRIIILFPAIIFLVIPLNYVIYNKIIWKTQFLSHGNTKKI